MRNGTLSSCQLSSEDELVRFKKPDEKIFFGRTTLPMQMSNVRSIGTYALISALALAGCEARDADGNVLTRQDGSVIMVDDNDPEARFRRQQAEREKAERREREAEDRANRIFAEERASEDSDGGHVC